MIMMSDRAASEMKRMVYEQDLGEVYLRVGVNCLLYTSDAADE